MKHPRYNMKPPATPEPPADGPRFVGYARVSTEDQVLSLQVDALKRAGVLPENLFCEKLSATKKDREALDDAIRDLRPGDTLVVWKLDRLARSQYEFLTRLRQIDDAEARLKSIVEPFDFGTPTGRLVLNTLIGVAQFESEITAARTKAGMQARRERGLSLGAEIKMTPDKIARALKLLNARKDADRKTVIEVAAILKVSTPSVYKYFKATTIKGRKHYTLKPQN